MSRAHVANAAVVLALLAPRFAYAQAIDIEWDAAGAFERSIEVPAGRFAELCGPLAQGAKVQWRFESPVPLDFNIHYHEGKDVHYPAREDHITQARGVLDVPRQQDYCWMWKNKNADAVTLRVALARS